MDNIASIDICSDFSIYLTWGPGKYVTWRMPTILIMKFQVIYTAPVTDYAIFGAEMLRDLLTLIFDLFTLETRWLFRVAWSTQQLHQIRESHVTIPYRVLTASSWSCAAYYVTCENGIGNSRVFGIPDPYLPTLRTTFMGLWWQTSVILRLRTKFRVNRTMNRGDIAKIQFSIWRPYAILDLVWRHHIESENTILRS